MHACRPSGGHSDYTFVSSGEAVGVRGPRRRDNSTVAISQFSPPVLGRASLLAMHARRVTSRIYPVETRNLILSLCHGGETGR